MKTGKLEIRSNAVVARILTGDTGLATGVQHFDRRTGAEQQVRGKAPSSARAVDSTRILPNSKSTSHANGPGNGSDVIGRYLCEQIRLNVTGHRRRSWEPQRRTTVGLAASTSTCRASIICPAAAGTTCVDSGRSSGTRARASPARTRARSSTSFGAALKSEIKRRHPAWFEIHPFGEVRLSRTTALPVDPSRVDRYGVPLPRIDYRIVKTNAR